MYLSALHHPLGGATARIPTLISEGPEGQAKLSDWPVSTSAFTNVKSVEADYCVGSNEMYWDENIDPYSSRNVTCRPCEVHFMVRYHSPNCHMALKGPGHSVP